jgi:hypothetical protein
MNKPFILMYNGFPLLVDLKRVSYPPKTKVTKTIKVDGFGNIPVTTPTGKFDHSQITLWKTSPTLTISENKTAIDSRLRRLRQQEAEELEKIDAEIHELRTRREALIKKAWIKGNVVTVKELTERAANA